MVEKRILQSFLLNNFQKLKQFSLEFLFKKAYYLHSL